MRHALGEDNLPNGRPSRTDDKILCKDKLAELELQDDSAHVAWGGNWYIASFEEWTELLMNCTESYVV